LLIGYVLIAAAITIGTIILLYQAYGFGVNKNGTVTQNGLVYFSSQPNPANVYLNSKLAKIKTNSRIFLPEGIYQVRISRTGYRSWQRPIEVDGGSVEHFDYPFLFPTTLTSTKLAPYASAPQLATQSPDQRWLIVLAAGNSNFDLYDLKNPTKVASSLSLPSSLVSTATTSQSWQVVAWADDNQHVLLSHTYDGKIEYILLDRNDPAASLNLTQTLNLDATTTLTLDNRKYDQYYAFDSATKTLDSVSLKDTTPTPVETEVLAFQPYSDNTILYVTDTGAPTGKVDVKFDVIGAPATTIRTLTANTTYLLNLTKYSGTMYVAAGAVSEGKVYIYKDPVSQLANKKSPIAVPAQVLRVSNPTWLQFSSNAQFIAAEGSSGFGVYDIESQHGYTYNPSAPLDSPQLHAMWMDGDRLTYVSGGKQIVLDYDGTNQQTLIAANPSFVPFFSSSYTFVYTLSPTSLGSPQTNLLQTSLLTKADQ
jgi:hypothetical protein